MNEPCIGHRPLRGRFPKTMIIHWKHVAVRYRIKGGRGCPILFSSKYAPDVHISIPSHTRIQLHSSAINLVEIRMFRLSNEKNSLHTAEILKKKKSESPLALDPLRVRGTRPILSKFDPGETKHLFQSLLMVTKCFR